MTEIQLIFEIMNYLLHFLHPESHCYNSYKCNSFPQAPHVKTIVKIGNEVTEEEREKAGAHNVSVMTYNDLFAEGEANPVPHNPPEPEDIATICYTSGTTGQFSHHLSEGLLSV